MTKTLWVLVTSIFLLGSVTGCQVTNSYYLGALADKAGVVPLPPETTHGLVWQDLNLTVNYDLKTDLDSVVVSGKIGFSNNPKIVYQQVNDMKVKFYLLDKNNRVVSYREVAKVLSPDVEDLTEFRAQLKRPVEAVAYTFGYEGDFIDDEGQAHTVWALPKVAR